MDKMIPIMNNDRFHVDINIDQIISVEYFLTWQCKNAKADDANQSSYPRERTCCELDTLAFINMTGGKQYLVNLTVDHKLGKILAALSGKLPREEEDTSNG